MDFDELRNRRHQEIKLESHLELFLFEEVKLAGGLAIKFDPTGNAGLPDVIIFHKGLVWLVELKSNTGKLGSHQIIKHKQFARHGHTVRVLYGKEQVVDFIGELKLV